MANVCVEVSHCKGAHGNMTIMNLCVSEAVRVASGVSMLDSCCNTAECGCEPAVKSEVSVKESLGMTMKA